jgi:hypothetical protein
MRRRILELACPVVAVVLCSCAAETPVTEVKGDCAPAFGSDLCTWAKVQGENVLETGIVVSVASIEASPADPPMVMPPKPDAAINLTEAVSAKTGLTEFTFFWEAHGHPPTPYLTPHYDFHFYLVPRAEREAIDCKDATKPTDLPAGYALPDEKLPPEVAKMLGTDVLIGVCIPQMGMHALLDSELKTTEPFRGTMVVGYWKGKPIFIEPMISKAMLLEKKSFELPIPTEVEVSKRAFARSGPLVLRRWTCHRELIVRGGH